MGRGRSGLQYEAGGNEKMKSTAAVLAGKNQVYVKEIDLPEIGEEELLVKVVCSSDLVGVIDPAV